MKIAPVLFYLPFSYAERFALGDQEVRVKISLEEYLAFAEECDYRIEYSNGYLVSMSQPTDIHEQIVLNIGWALNNLFTDDDPFRAYGSNLGVYVNAEAHYKPDVTVVQDMPRFIRHKVGKKNVKSVLNPFAAFEIFSDSTQHYDVREKLPNFKTCLSLQYIIFVHQHKPFVTVYTRSENEPSGWSSIDYEGLDASFPFENHEVKLRHLYRKVIFMEP